MSAPDLNAIRARAAAATEGDWKVTHAGNIHYGVRAHIEGDVYPATVVFAQADSQGYGNGSRKVDAEFIAHARQDIPALCDEVEQLRQSIAVTGGLYRSAESDVTQIMAAMTELVHHGDLTLFGRRVLERIIGGGE